MDNEMPNCRIDLFSTCMMFAFVFHSDAGRPDRSAPLPEKRKPPAGTPGCISVAGRSLDLSFTRNKTHCIHLAVIIICPGVFLDLCGKQHRKLPSVLRRTLAGTAPEFAAGRQMDAVTWTALRQLVCTRASAFGRQIRRRKTALELVARETKFLLHPVGGNHPPHLSTGDHERLDRARAILMKKMAVPPDIKTLARQVGMNEYKFKKGFKTLFGEPPMTFLRRYRMEEARRLLQRDNISVTQAALSVGFSNPSSFSACYARYYGHTPGRRTPKNT